MQQVLKAFLLLLGLAIIVCGIGFLYFINTGVSAKEKPGRVEEFVAGRARDMAIARRAGALTNPIKESADVIAEGRAHFADHCALCHANDGSGQTVIGQGLWPKAPDMRLGRTQNLSDGELFWIIENGIRFTGMPSWSTGTQEGEQASWNLVHFIRRLPKVTPEEIKEMESLNPKSPDEDPSGKPAAPHHHEHQVGKGHE